MSKSTISTFQLFALFPDEGAARVYLEGRIWPDGVKCPDCGGDRITPRPARVGFYHCNQCGFDFTVRSRTIMERSKLPLRKWLMGGWRVWCNPDVTSEALAAEMEIQPVTAWYLIQRVTEACAAQLEARCIGWLQDRVIVKRSPMYAVGPDGSVWTRRRKGRGQLGYVWRQMHPTVTALGHHVVTLTDRKQVYVHDLICTAFHGDRPSPAHQCRHLNGVAGDARSDNLAWGTVAQNRADAVAHGTVTGEANGRAKLTDTQIAEIMTLRGREKRRVIGERFGISITYVSYLWSGRYRVVEAAVQA
jgi:hypothetical protein